jgi:GNAT superfamily N-acetyltransferase
VLVDRALVTRVETFFAERAAATTRALATLEPESGAAVAERAGGVVVYMGPGMFLNRASALGVSEPAVREDVDFVIDFFAARDRQAEIELCPYAHDAIRERAAERGFALDWFRNVYAARLAGPGPGLIETAGAAEGVEFTPVNDAALATWEAIWLHEGSDAVVSRFIRAVHHTAGETAFVASIDGEPAAVCSMAISGGLADFGGMTTLPAFRRRGVQRACLSHRLEVARAAGCDVAVTSATPNGESARNIERAGFACMYTSVGLVRPLRPPNEES